MKIKYDEKHFKIDLSGYNIDNLKQINDNFPLVIRLVSLSTIS